MVSVFARKWDNLIKITTVYLVITVLFAGLMGSLNTLDSLSDISKESNLLKWLIKYEEMGMSLLLFSYSDIDFLHPEKNIFFRVGGKVKILASDFENTIVFKELFDEHYWEMLEKRPVLQKKTWRN